MNTRPRQVRKVTVPPRIVAAALAINCRFSQFGRRDKTSSGALTGPSCRLLNDQHIAVLISGFTPRRNIGSIAGGRNAALHNIVNRLSHFANGRSSFRVVSQAAGGTLHTGTERLIDIPRQNAAIALRCRGDFLDKVINDWRAVRWRNEIMIVVNRVSQILSELLIDGRRIVCGQPVKLATNARECAINNVRRGPRGILANPAQGCPGELFGLVLHEVCAAPAFGLKVLQRLPPCDLTRC
jgi:hypothetical protein